MDSFTSYRVPPTDLDEKPAFTFADNFDQRMQELRESEQRDLKRITPETDLKTGLWAKATDLTDRGKEAGQLVKEKGKGVGQVAAGGALMAAGVPMLILPGPGIAAIAGGAALAGQGLKNLKKDSPETSEADSPEGQGLPTQTWESPTE